jgi:hypothetical protein
MSNPVATIGSSVPEPSDPSLSRKSYSLLEFDSIQQKNYKLGEQSGFSPADQAASFIMTVPLDDALGSTKPGFISQDAWDKNDKYFPSVFSSAAWNSIMPKLLIPSEVLVDNGLNTNNGSVSTFWAWSTAFTKDVFNWTVVSVNGTAIGPTNPNFFDYVCVGATFGSQYCTSFAKKDDNSASNDIVVELQQPADPPVGDWDETTLVVGGAFVLMLNVVPLVPAGADPQTIQEKSWTVELVFGDVTMQLNQTGALTVTIAGTGDDTDQKANMVEGKSKQGPPQQKHIVDKDPYIIAVYPVWNGLVVTSGISDATSSLASTSQFIEMNRKASIKIPPYSTWFDPSAPADVEVDAPADVKVNFGNKMTITAKSCRFDWAYLPVFFSREGWFDYFCIEPDNVSGTVSYTFKVYKIYTLNGTSYSVTETMTDTGTTGPNPFTHYEKDAWVMSLSGTQFSRFGPQVFAAILETTETRQFPVKNGNGSFSLAWTGGSPGDPSPTTSWVDYIQSISVTIGKDGSNGSINIDKYGIAGQDAIATQSIGAITIDATGGDGTTGGSIFQGLAIGVSENLSVDGATWTIPVFGLEKKMEDIALINIPFFDGKMVSDAIDFLCRYAGIIYDTSNAPLAASTQLGISEDLNVPRYDWRSGTSVKAALDAVMTDRGFTYVVRDGKIYFYELDTSTAMPTYLGPDRNPGGATYPNTKVTAIDRTPDFDDLRNEVVVIALDGIKAGQGTDISNIPLFPRMAVKRITTTPDVPWAKSWVDGVPGQMSAAELQTTLNNDVLKTRLYSISGKTTIPGNADIKPFDQWNGYAVLSVTHNLDFQNKTWTTDLELVWHG